MEKISKKHYAKIHHWLWRNYDREKCENSKCLTPDKGLEFALKKGFKHEKKRENYIVLCSKCHTEYDRGQPGTVDRRTEDKFIQIKMNGDFHGIFKSLCAREGVAMSDKIKDLMLNEVNSKVDPAPLGMPFDYEIENPKP